MGDKKRPLKEYPVYTKEEADQKGLTYKKWDSIELGDEDRIYGVLSEDGYVGELLKTTEYQINLGTQQKNIEVKCVYANYWLKEENNKPLLFEERYRKRSYSHVTGKSFRETNISLKREKMKNLIYLYAQMLVNAPRVDWDKLGQMWNPNGKKPRESVRRVFKIEKVRKAVDEEVKRLLEDIGMSKRWTIEKQKRMMEMAEANNDPGNMQKGIDRLSKWWGWDNAQKETKSIEENTMRQIAENIKEVKKLKIQQSIEGNNILKENNNGNNNEQVREGNQQESGDS